MNEPYKVYYNPGHYVRGQSYAFASKIADFKATPFHFLGFPVGVRVRQCGGQQDCIQEWDLGAGNPVFNLIDTHCDEYATVIVTVL